MPRVERGVRTVPRLVLGALTLALLAGCLAVPPAGDATDGLGRQQGSADDGSLPQRELPERPEELNRSSAVEFVTAYERAHGWNREVTANTTELSINPVRTEILRTTEDGYVVHLEVGLSHYVRHDGDVMVGDGFYTANYLVNETAILRAETGGAHDPGPDPRNGTVLEG